LLIVDIFKVSVWKHVEGSLWKIRMMLNTEVSWNKALTDNNIKGLVGCLRGLCTEGRTSVSYIEPVPRSNLGHNDVTW